MRDAYVVPMRKVMTSRDKVHFERLPAKPQPCCQQHSTTTELITQAVRNWSEVPVQLFFLVNRVRATWRIKRKAEELFATIQSVHHNCTV